MNRKRRRKETPSSAPRKGEAAWWAQQCSVLFSLSLVSQQANTGSSVSTFLTRNQWLDTLPLAEAVIWGQGVLWREREWLYHRTCAVIRDTEMGSWREHKHTGNQAWVVVLFMEYFEFDLDFVPIYAIINLFWKCPYFVLFLPLSSLSNSSTWQKDIDLVVFLLYMYVEDV